MKAVFRPFWFYKRRDDAVPPNLLFPRSALRAAAKTTPRVKLFYFVHKKMPTVGCRAASRVPKTPACPNVGTIFGHSRILPRSELCHIVRALRIVFRFLAAIRMQANPVLQTASFSRHASAVCAQHLLEVGIGSLQGKQRLATRRRRQPASAPLTNLEH